MADDDAESDDEWEEVEEEGRPTTCLLCPAELPSPTAVLQHCVDQHHFSLIRLKKQFGAMVHQSLSLDNKAQPVSADHGLVQSLDFYGFVRLTNYLRSSKPSAEQFVSLLAAIVPGTTPPWESDEYLVSVVQDDTMLQYDFDGLDSTDSDVEGMGCTGEDVEGLRTRLREAGERAEGYRLALEQSLEDMEMMRQRVKELFTVTDEEEVPPPRPPLDDAHQLTSLDCDSYFTSYANLTIHEEMIKDHPRTSAYRDFIMGNPQLFKGRVVLDVGCGTGILSLLAARAGAATVFAVDCSSVIHHAMEIGTENGVGDVVQFVRGRVEEVELSGADKVDVIISEWMGYCLLFESMLDSVIAARDRFLKDPSQVYPNKCSLYLGGVSSLAMYQDKVTFWDNAYGFQMSCMKRRVVSEAAVSTVESKHMATSISTLKEFDLSTVTVPQLDFTAPFTLQATRDGDIHAFLLYFDAKFIPNKEGNPVILNTSPEAPATHWGQTLLFLSKPHPLSVGGWVQGQLSCHKSTLDQRALDIEISWSANDSLQKVKQQWTISRE